MNVFATFNSSLRNNIRVAVRSSKNRCVFSTQGNSDLDELQRGQIADLGLDGAVIVARVAVGTA